MKKILALIFCIFLAGCASKPSVKNLNLKSSLNYGDKELAKILEQDDAVAFSSNLREGVFIYISNAKVANYLGVVRAERHAKFSVKELGKNDLLIKSVNDLTQNFDASLERARELKCGTLVIRLKDKFQDLEAANKFLEQNESAFLKMSGEISCK